MASNPSEKTKRAMSKRIQVAKQPKPFLGGFDTTTRFPGFISVVKALTLITTASVASFASQLALAPVYGDIPSSLYHLKISTAVFVAAWTAKYSPVRLPHSLKNVLPIIALYTPAIQRYLFRYSDSWGPKSGPIYTEGTTYYPILFLTVLQSALLLDLRNVIFDSVLGVLSLSFFLGAGSYVPNLLRNHIGSSWILTRCGLPQLFGALYALLSPSFLLLAAIPALYHTATVNTMCITTPALNETLALSNYTMLARQESNTGYVAILESKTEGYRIMRCDHSLLGGEWQRAPKGFEHLDLGYKEPVYAIFVTMEAVRLVDPPPKNPKPRALAIGLGIGTAVNGLLSHGVETDIVELDPVVYKYAKEFFELKLNHTAYIEDAIGFVKREAAVEKNRKQYEFILHDVFTGGAVPASLFTSEFFSDLRTLLTEDGVIAINWAGDLKLQAAKSIIMTVMSTFNNCRVFREDMPEKDVETAAVDFTNMVIFCTRSEKPYTFRAPTRADFLGSYAREQFLFPKYEINLEHYFSNSSKGILLNDRSIGSLVAWQQTSALGHWKVIRTVVPPSVWENY
ncbi:S-adenosyl-L-methionine-dependent methyltransferase [Morchella snyderi]|nr:S-adenosyl-L-methionine-dependent methyltransferase [Morchella snyderi]